MRYLIFFFISLLALSLQTTVFARLSLFGAMPDLTLILVVCFALLEGTYGGILAAFIGGLLTDIFSVHVLGVQLLSKLLLAYLIGLTEEKIFKENPMVSVVGIIFATFVDYFLTCFLYQSFGIIKINFLDMQRIFWGELIYNVVLIPVIYVLLYKWLVRVKN